MVVKTTGIHGAPAMHHLVGDCLAVPAMDDNAHDRYSSTTVEVQTLSGDAKHHLYPACTISVRMHLLQRRAWPHNPSRSTHCVALQQLPLINISKTPKLHCSSVACNAAAATEQATRPELVAAAFGAPAAPYTQQPEAGLTRYIEKMSPLPIQGKAGTQVTLCMCSWHLPVARTPSGGYTTCYSTAECLTFNDMYLIQAECTRRCWPAVRQGPGPGGAAVVVPGAR